MRTQVGAWAHQGERLGSPLGEQMLSAAPDRNAGHLRYYGAGTPALSCREGESTQGGERELLFTPSLRACPTDLSLSGL